MTVCVLMVVHARAGTTSSARVRTASRDPGVSMVSRMEQGGA